MTTMSTCNGPFPEHRRFDRIERPALHWNLGSAPVNLSLLLAVLRPATSPEEDAVLRRLFLVRLLDRQGSDPKGSLVS